MRTPRRVLGALRRMGFGAVLATGLVFASTGVASAATASCTPGVTYPAGQCALVVSATVVHPGEPITVSGFGYAAHSTVIIDFHSAAVFLGTATTDANGAFSTTVTIPTTAAPGNHTITATGINPDGTPRVLSVAVTIPFTATGTASAAPPSSSSGSPLATTGVDAAALLGVGLGAAGLGSLMIASSRRKRTSSTES